MDTVPEREVVREVPVREREVIRERPVRREIVTETRVGRGGGLHPGVAIGAIVAVLVLGLLLLLSMTGA